MGSTYMLGRNLHVLRSAAQQGCGTKNTKNFVLRPSRWSGQCQLCLALAAIGVCESESAQRGPIAGRAAIRGDARGGDFQASVQKKRACLRPVPLPGESVRVRCNQTHRAATERTIRGILLNLCRHFLLLSLLTGTLCAREPENAKTASPAAGALPDDWAFQPLKRPVIPASSRTTHHESLNPIDAFVGARLAENALPPSPEADTRTLLRR